MRVKYFLNVVIVVSLLSCSDSEDKCETYYLYSSSSNSDAYYNSDGMVSEYIAGTDTLVKFEYNSDKQLKSKKGLELDLYYYYDETKKLKYLLEYDNGNFLDSITIVFNQQNQISTMVYHSYFDSYLQPTKAIEYEYSGRNSTKARYYVLDTNDLPNLKLSSTFLYDFDDKKLPFPKETWPFYKVFDDRPISENNVIKQVLRSDGAPDFETVFSYKYNSGGYPIQMRMWNVGLQEFTYSCKPRLRGTK